jgi:hypothetical protein
MIGGDRSTITQDDRNEIIRLYFGASPASAQAYATKLGLRDNYAYRLVLERGLVPRTYRNWGRLKESA